MNHDVGSIGGNNVFCNGEGLLKGRGKFFLGNPSHSFSWTFFSSRLTSPGYGSYNHVFWVVFQLMARGAGARRWHWDMVGGRLSWPRDDRVMMWKEAEKWPLSEGEWRNWRDEPQEGTLWNTPWWARRSAGGRQARLVETWPNERLKVHLSTKKPAEY